MANLKNLDKLRTEHPQLVTIGNNRQARNYAGTMTGFLHGHQIVSMDTPNGILTLSTCGYLTATTIAAMGDFLDAFGLVGRASRAGGKLSVRIKSRERGEWIERETDGETLIIPLAECATRDEWNAELKAEYAA